MKPYIPIGYYKGDKPHGRGGKGSGNRSRNNMRRIVLRSRKKRCRLHLKQRLRTTGE